MPFLNACNGEVSCRHKQPKGRPVFKPFHFPSNSRRIARCKRANTAHRQEQCLACAAFVFRGQARLRTSLGAIALRIWLDLDGSSNFHASIQLRSIQKETQHRRMHRACRESERLHLKSIAPAFRRFSRDTYLFLWQSPHLAPTAHFDKKET